MNSASRNPKSSNIPNPKLSGKHTVPPTSLPIPFDLCPSLADVQSSSPNPNFSKSLSNFGGHSPKHSIHSTPTRKLQQVFQQKSEMVESEERISRIVDNLKEEMRGSNGSFDIYAIATKLKHIKQAWNVADVQSRPINELLLYTLNIRTQI
ncbi:hypothetical protein RHMOL_Rhmol04G0222700 [Rhododendron molle]|uniref:Uncharacterized protein n=1 Tax=Rhododendron molle TaxID=49168 RepID=A0ACC0P3I4_RHOML|nr:hypothetical protein RHMOL_Rhmol04G0222700 [Rhododendron molle]